MDGYPGNGGAGTVGVPIIGAGAIARAVLAPLLQQNGRSVVFLCSNESRARALDAKRQYVVHLAGTPARIGVSEFRAFAPSDPDFYKEVASADFAFTAVRAKNLPSLAPTIGTLIRERIALGVHAPLNVICCENLPVGGAPLEDLRAGVKRCTPECAAFINDNLGLIGAVVDGTALAAPDGSGEFDVLRDLGQSALLVDATAVKGALPDIRGVQQVVHICVHRKRKSFIHGLGHAALAYLSASRGLKKMADGMRVPDICSLVRGAMRESADALCVLHPDIFNNDALSDYIEDLLRRFADSSFGDTVERVGRDAWCKLAPDERIIGSLRNAQTAGVRTDAISVVVDAAVTYAREHENDGCLKPAPADVHEVALSKPLSESWAAFKTRANIETVVDGFFDASLDPRLFPRVVVLDVDGTLTETVGQDLPGEMAELILRVRDRGVHVILLSGFSKARFTEQFLPALRAAGPGSGIAVFGGCGAFGWLYDELWNAQTLHGITFSAATVGSESTALLTAAEVDGLAAAVRRIVPGAVVAVRDTHIAFRAPDQVSAEAAAASVHDFLARSGLNDNIRNRLSGSSSFSANDIGLQARVSNDGLVNICLVTKDVGLRWALRAVEERSCGVCTPDRTLVIDDSIAVDRRLYSGNDLLRVRVGGRAPVIFDVSDGPRDLAAVESTLHIGESGPTATASILRGIAAVNPGPEQKRVLPSIRQRAAGVYLVTGSTSGDPRPGTSIRPARCTGLLRVAEAPQFDDAVRSGSLRPVIVVTIKNLFRGAPQLYLQELISLSQVYDGNADLLLVTQPPSAIRNDFPSLFTTVEQAITVLGPAFFDRPVLIVTDAGRKTRNFPLTLRYGFQGLFPFDGFATYLREVLSRAGVLFGKSEQPSDYAVVVASDSIMNFGALDSLPPSTALSIPLAPLSADAELNDKVVAVADADGTVFKVLAKPTSDIAARSGIARAPGRLWTLPFAIIWHKRIGLEHLLRQLQHASLQNGRSFVYAPTDFYHGVIEGLYAADQDWQDRRPPEMSAPEWSTLRHLALETFGSHGSRVAYPRLSVDGFRDEGHIQISRRRIELSASHPLSEVTVAPGARVSGAFFATGRRLVVTGRGHLEIGKHVHFSDVVIDLGNGGNLTIPDRWTLHDCYLSSTCRFEGPDGFLSGVFRPCETAVPVAAVSGQTFSGQNAATMILSTDREVVRVDIPLSESKELLAASRFGTRRLSLEELQDCTDGLAANLATRELKSFISRNLSAAPGTFPLDASGTRVVSTVPYAQFVDELASDIIARKHRSRLFWVTLEGLQGAGKSYLANALRKELRSRGQSVIVLEEDWSHLPRGTRERLRDEDPRAFLRHRETWHDWDRNRETIRTVAETRSGYIMLRNLYNRASGLCDASRRAHVRQGSVVIYTGFYVSDSSVHGIPDDPDCRLALYLGISPDDSLWVKRHRDRWRSPKEIVDFDREVYRPAFVQYTQLFNPAAQADYVLLVRPTTRQAVALVRPAEVPLIDPFHSPLPGDNLNPFPG